MPIIKKTMIKTALTVENLTKIYLDSKTKKENKALSNLCFEVKQGEVFGLLGPNGAGKTTFLSILGGTVTKTSGRVNVWGFNLDKNPRQVKASIGIVPQEVNLDAFFSPHKLLERIQTKKINFIVKDVDLNKSLSLKGIQFKINSKKFISATYEKGSLDFGEIINYFSQNDIKIEDISTEDGDLEDVFVQLTKH